MRSFKILQFSVSILLIAGAFLLYSCTRSVGVKEQAQARIALEESRKQYRSEKWTIRRKAVEQLTVFLTQFDKSIITLIISNEKEGRNSIVSFYLKVAEDKHASIRIEALKGLAVVLSDKAYGKIAEMALHDRSDNVRWYAVQALSLYRNNESAEIFIQCLQDDDWLIREAAIMGILMLDEEYQAKNMVYFIIKAINDPNNKVKAAALSGVSIKDASIYYEMAELMRDKENLNSTLLIALLKGLQGYQLTTDIRKNVIELLSYKNAQVRILALRVLKKEKILMKNKKR